MRTEEEIDAILKQIKGIWLDGDNKYLRLGQLLYVLSEKADRDLFNVEDWEWEDEFARGVW